MDDDSFTKFDAPDRPRGPTARDDLHDVIILPKVPRVPKAPGEPSKNSPVAYRFPINRKDGEHGGGKTGEYGPTAPASS
jgi:hypothetical protein